MHGNLIQIILDKPKVIFPYAVMVHFALGNITLSILIIIRTPFAYYNYKHLYSCFVLFYTDIKSLLNGLRASILMA